MTQPDDTTCDVCGAKVDKNCEAQIGGELD